MKKLLLTILITVMVMTTAFSTVVFGDTNNNTQSKNVTILFSHDMHSHLEKFSKIKTIINDAKQENEATFVVDAGDFSMGTPYQTIYKDEASELRMMGTVGYDVTTLGNHEFDYRSAGLTTMLKRAMKSLDENFPRLYSEEKVLPEIVISNIDWDSTLADEDKKTDGKKLQKTLKEYGAKDYTVIEKEGVKIAFFGIFGNESASYAPESGTDFLDPVSTAKAVVEKIKTNENVDMIVCLSHSGTNPDDSSKSEDEILAEKVDGIDLIISGHSHTKLSKPIVKNDTIIASCGQYNDNLGEIQFSSKNGKFNMESYKINKLDKSVTKDIRTEFLVGQFKSMVNDEYFSKFGYNWDETLAYNNIEFTSIDKFGTKQGEDGLGNLIADSYIYGVKKAEGSKYETVDVAVAPAGVIRGSFGLGRITTEDAFNALSLGTGKDGKPGYPLVSIYLDGSELKTMAEVDISISDMMQPARLYISGLSYKYNPNRIFLDRAYDIKLTKADGSIEEIDDDKLYRVVGDLYSCQMLGTVNSQSKGILSITPKNKKGEEIKNFEDYIIYDGSNDELKEWYALASYIDAFSNNRVPSRYSKSMDRKILVDSKNIFDILKSPNKLFKMAICLIILILAILILIIVLIVKFINRMRYGKGYARRKRLAKKNKEKPIFSNGKSRYR